MNRILTLITFTLFTLSVASCNNSIDGEGNTDYTYEDYVDDYAAAWCARNVKCGSFPDVASCIESGTVTLQQFTADIEAGSVILDLQVGRDCLAIVADSACTVVNLPKCLDTTGAVTIGGQCFRTYSCSDDAYCDGADRFACTAGVCAARPTAGQSCNSECSSGLVCSLSGTCMAPAGLGEDCSTVSCISGYACGVGNLCAPYANTGENCSFEGGGCLQLGDFCDEQAVCSPKIEVGGNCAVGKCVSLASCISDVCVAKSGIGESCDDLNELYCIGRTTCENNICVPIESFQTCSLP